MNLSLRLVCGVGVSVITCFLGGLLPEPVRAAEPEIAADAALRGTILGAKRIVFLGDSITAGAKYVMEVATVLATRNEGGGRPEVLSVGLSSETTSGLSEEGHGGVGEKAFARPDVHERLSRVLSLLKPDVVFACYGINCGIYQPLDEGRFEAFRKGMRRLHESVERTGAKIVHITPPFFDESRKPGHAFYPEVMRRYSEWLVGQRSEGWQVIDLYTAMAAEVMTARKADPGFTFSPDGIHPNDAGHWLMARQVLGWLGEGEAAKAGSAQEWLRARGVSEEVRKLVSQRVALLRDSYVAAAGHKRPFTAKGLPVEEAEAKAREWDVQIAALLKR
jgi:lysophospholipase L1-like esterase